MNNRITEQPPGHRQNHLVAVPNRAIARTEHDRITLRNKRHVIVRNNRHFLGRHGIRSLSFVLHEQSFLILRDCFGIRKGLMRRTRHLLQGIQHRVVRRLQEHDITRVTLYDLIHRLAVYVTQLLQRLQNQRKLLFLAQSDRQHRCKTGDTMTFRLQVTQLIQHEPGLIQRLLIALGHVGLIEVQINQLLHQDQNQLGILHQVRRCYQEHHLRLLRIPDLRPNDRCGVHRLQTSSRQHIRNLHLLKRRLCLPIDDFTILRLELPQLDQNTVLHDLIAKNRVRHVIPGVQRRLIGLPELEIKRPNQHASLRIHDLQPNIRDISRIFPLEIILCPAFAGHRILMVKILAHFLREVLILIGHPLSLHTNQMVFRQKIRMETNAKRPRERHARQIRILRRRTGRQGRNCRVRKE